MKHVLVSLLILSMASCLCPRHSPRPETPSGTSTTWVGWRILPPNEYSRLPLAEKQAIMAQLVEDLEDADLPCPEPVELLTLEIEPDPRLGLTPEILETEVNRALAAAGTTLTARIPEPKPVDYECVDGEWVCKDRLDLYLESGAPFVAVVPSSVGPLYAVFDITVVTRME